MRKSLYAATAALALAAVAAGAAVWYHTGHRNAYLNGSAATVAKALGCGDFTVQKQHSRLAQFHDQGTCTLDGKTVQVTTFSSTGEQQAYTILMTTLAPVYLKHGGAYAEGTGWVVADDVSLSRTVAVSATRRLGGSVREFPAAGSSSANS